MSRPPLPEETVAMASRLWSQGQTAAEIARALNTTRNAVLGMSSRYRPRFPKRPKPADLAREATSAPAKPPAIRRRTILVANSRPNFSSSGMERKPVSVAAMPWDPVEPLRATPFE